MSLLVSLLAAVVVFIAGWAVIKRYPTVIVLFAAGFNDWSRYYVRG